MERETKPLENFSRVALDFCARTPLVENRRWIERCIWKLLDALKKPSPKILEANCTDGWDTEIFLQRGARVSAVCSSQERLDFARRRAPDAEFHLTNSDSKSETFDAVWCINVFQSLTLDAAPKIFKEFARVLKLNGLLIFNLKNDAVIEMLKTNFEILERESYPEECFEKELFLITAQKR